MDEKKNNQHFDKENTFVSNQWLETESTPEEFSTRLEKAGYALAQGDKAKFVILDRRSGKVESLLSHLPGIKLAEVEKRIEHEKLPSVPELMGVEGQEVQQKREAYRKNLNKKENIGKETPQIQEEKAKKIDAQLQKIKEKSVEKDHSNQR